MLGVVIIHILTVGGGIEANNAVITYLLLTIVDCAVNCYALTTGFVYFSEEDKPLRISKYISLWFQVTFYSVGLYLYGKYLGLVSTRQLVEGFFPVISKQYWYFSAYTPLFFLIPVLNQLVQKIQKKDLKKVFMFVGLISCFCVLTKLLDTDPFGLNGGMSFLWLLILYIVGACIKKFNIAQKIQTKKAVKIIAGCIIFTWLWKIIVVQVTQRLLGKMVAGEIFLDFVSPTILCIAICSFLIFQKMKLKEGMKKIIAFLSPSVFAVYLFQEHLFIRELIMIDKYHWISQFNVWATPFVVLGVAILIFSIGILMDKVRILIFKLLKINQVSEKIEQIIGKLFKNNQVKKEGENTCTTPTS